METNFPHIPDTGNMFSRGRGKHRSVSQPSSPVGQKGQTGKLQSG